MWRSKINVDSFRKLNRVVTCRALSTTSALFDSVPHKNKSCVWSQSRDMVTYIPSCHSLVLKQPQTSFRYVQIETTPNMGEHTASKNTSITIKILKMGIFATLSCSGLCMNVKIASHIQIHTFSYWGDENFAATKLLLFQHTYTRICSNKTQSHL